MKLTLDQMVELGKSVLAYISDKSYNGSYLTGMETKSLKSIKVIRFLNSANVNDHYEINLFHLYHRK